MDEGKKESVAEATFLKWPFSKDFKQTVVEGKVVKAICKYCPEIDERAFDNELRRRNLRGKVLTSAKNYRKEVSYIHKPTLARHVGDEKSLHNWCKKNFCLKTGEQFHVTTGVSTQPSSQISVASSISASSFSYYQKLFRTVLYLVEEEYAFTKLRGLIDLQMRNGLKFGSLDKLGSDACKEMVDVIADVLVEVISGYFEESNFMTASADASEARKTSEEKELVFGKILVKGVTGVVPCCFLLKCQSLKQFGGANGQGTFEAMKNALKTYVSEEDIKIKLICIASDGASVNFGVHQGAITRMREFVGWLLYAFHCTNHQLELCIKSSFTGEKTFTDLKEMLETLYKLFKNSGKSWRLFQLLAETMRVKALRFTRCGGTRFQGHTRKALANFLRNFLVTMMFSENVEQNGSGKDRIVTKEMYPKIVGFRKKWSKFLFIGSANLYFQVLNETALLSMLMESDAVMVYQVEQYVKEICSNLNDLATSNEYDFLPFNIEEIGIEEREKSNWMLEDSMKTKVTATTAPLKLAKRMKTMSDEERNKVESKIKVVKENFTFHNVDSGKKQVETCRREFVPKIAEGIKERFALFEDESMAAFSVFNVSLWSLASDTDHMYAVDVRKLEIISKSFEHVLKEKEFTIKDATKEWKRVKNIVRQTYMNLQEQQAQLWCRFLYSHGHLYPNIALLLEITILMMPSSAIVERGFSTLKRNLRDNRSSLKNKGLNSILTITINMPSLRKIMANATEEIVLKSIQRYFESKKWRWEPRALATATTEPMCTSSFSSCSLPRKVRLQDFDDEDSVDDESSDDGSDTDASLSDVDSNDSIDAIDVDS